MSGVDASSCTAADGKIIITVDAAAAGTSPYAISLDNGKTWTYTGLTKNASERLTVDKVAWGTYAIAIRDASAAVIYPGSVGVKGCVYEACSPTNDDFVAVAVPNATNYTWSTSVGSIKVGQGTRIVKLGLAGIVGGTVGEVCVTPSGPGCAAAPTCFGVRVSCAEVCDDGIDNDGDGLTDAADPDCFRSCTYVTNTRDAGYGSLRQAIICANNRPGLDTIRFNIPKTDAGFDASRGVFRIAALSSLPTITDSLLVDGFTQTAFTGNTNATVLGTGGFVGVDKLPLSKVEGTEIEVYGTTNAEIGFDIASSRTTLRGLAVYGFYGFTIHVNGSSKAAGIARVKLERNLFGVRANTLDNPDDQSSRNWQDVMSLRVTKAWESDIKNNIFAWSGGHGIEFRGGSSSNILVENNEFVNNAWRIVNRDALAITQESVKGLIVRGNLIHQNTGPGVDLFQSNGNGSAIVNNTILRNGQGSTSVATTENPGVRATQSIRFTISRNVIENNYGAGILVANGSNSITITENAIRANGSMPNRRGDAKTGQYGIDLHSSSSNDGTGDAPYVTINTAPIPGSRANGRLNFPIFTKAIFENGNLVLEGFAPKGATIEVFEAAPEEDNKINQTYFGEGGKHLLSLTEGGTASQEKHPLNQQTTVDPFKDLSSALGSYSSDAGAETDASAFRFEIPATAVPQLSIGMRLTSTSIATNATVAAIGGNYGNTSEFSGNFTLYETEMCGDGIDNDGDGLIDCDDPDCGYPVADAGPDQSTCPNADVTLVGKASSGTPPYTYAWSDGLGATATVTFEAAATKTYTLTVTDANGCTSTDVVKVTTVDVTPPTFVAFSPSVTVECHQLAGVAAVTATDACGPVTVTFVDGVGPKTCPNAYAITRTYTAKDANGNTRTATRTITVQDTQKPTFDKVPDDVVAECGTVVAKPILTATDLCAPAPAVTYAEAPCSQDVSPAYYYAGSAPITYLASLNKAPTVSYPSTVAPLVLTAMCTTDPSKQLRWRIRNPNSFPVLMTAMDEAPNLHGRYVVPAQTDVFFFTRPISGVLEAKWVDQAGAPQRTLKSINLTVCVLPAVESCPCGIVRTWTATDACGNESAVQQRVYLVDRTKPVLANLPAATLTTSCENVPLPAAVTVTDGCSTATPLDFVETRTAGACANAYTLRRTWSAVDQCGNTASFVQTITVTDDVKPTISSVPPTATVECGSPLPTALPVASDNCTVNVKLVESQSDGAASCARASVIRLFTATDECGNTATATQRVDFVDTKTPVFAGVPADVTIGCADAEPTTKPTATDLCAGTVAVSVTRSEAVGACAGSKTVTRVFTATDACGNTATASQVITIEDKTKPVLASVPASVTIECGAAEPTALPTATDACDPAPKLTVARTETNGACAGQKSVTRVFTATDACGNTATASQVITIEDKAKPVLAAVPANVTIECGDAEPTTLPTATDACDPAPNVTVARTEVAGACAGQKTVTRVFTATDACGNIATASQVVTIEDKTKPVLAAVPANVTIACGATEPTSLPTATDACDPAPKVTVARTESAGACAGSKTVTRLFTATDACGNAATASQVVTIEDKTKPVLASVPAGVTIECGAAEPTALPTATDACDPAPKVVVSRSEIAGACAGQRVVTRVFSATDACGNVATASQVITIEDKTKPVLAAVPASVILECGAAEPTTLPTATDACDPAPKVTVARTEAAGACSGQKTITRVFTATDACGNTATASQVITVEDKAKPVLASIPANVTIECGTAEPTALPSATDACDPAPKVTVARTEVTGACAGQMVVTRVFTATDACGNTATASQVITIEDKTKPVLASVPASVTIACGAPEPTALPSATDACDPVPKLTVARTETAGACAGQKTVTRVFTATDACGNTATASQVITIEDKTRPVLASIPTNVTIECGAAEPTALPTATDVCDPAPKVSVTRTEVADACAGQKTVTRVFTATDACGNIATASQVITIEDKTKPILAAVPASVTIECGAAEPTALPTATDACDPAPNVTVARTEVAGPCVGQKTVTRVFTATDACGNAATASQVVTIEDKTKPVLASVPASVTIACGAAEPTVLPIATDACDPAPKVTVARTEVAGACAGQTTVTRVFTATDACGNIATASQVITIEDKTKPVLASVPTDVTIACGTAEPSALPSATDACDPAPKVTVARTEVAGACAGQKTVTRVFTATDACGNIATASQVITIEDKTKPVLAAVPASVTIECGAAEPTTLPTATDACDPAPKVTVVRTETAGACAGQKTVTRTFTATDACGNTATASQVVTIEDKTKPVLAAVPANVTIECGVAEPTALPTATDACDPAPNVTVARTEVAGACAGQKTVTRVFTATDACGNVATASQVIKIEDKTKPVLASVPANVMIECGVAEPTALPTATDACDPAPNVTVARTEVAGACAGQKTVTRVFTATDACGNVATASQVIKIEDKTKPVLASVPANVMIECGVAEPTALPTATDACDPAPKVTVARTEAAGACAGQKIVTRTFTATDACGNVATASQVITIEDKTKPVLASVPANVMIECGVAEPTALPTATDACDPAPKVTVARTEVTGACAGQKTVTRVFTATDACGNIATASQVITIEDKTKPVLASVPASVSIECGAAEPTAFPTATDACDPAPKVTVSRTEAAGVCAGQKTVTRIFTATDACGNIATASQVITIEDKTKPVLAAVPTNVTIECGATEPTALPTATDACDPAPKVTVARTEAAGVCAGQKTVTRVFTARDACGNIATASQVITIEDKTKPVLAAVPANVILECGATEPTALPTATDACDPAPKVTVARTEAAGVCAGQKTVTRVFTARDACGNIATASQVITIEDKTKPVLAAVPANVILECGAAEPTALPSATDACDPAPKVTVARTETAGACAGQKTITRVFTATDACGNTVTASQVVTIEDKTKPVLASVPGSLTIECGAAEPTTLPSATDACDPAPIVTVARTEAAGACAGQKTITRVFTATDACGNTATASQVITIEDKTKPVLANVPVDLTIECGTAEPTALPTADDLCDPAPNVSVVSSTAAGACAGESVITRLFTATDACGNAATASQVITVRDRTKPVLADVPADVSLTCGQALQTAVPSATDACSTSVTVSETNSRTNGGSANQYTVTRVFTATDACGNTATASQVITYTDSGGPVWTNVPAAVTLGCGEATPTTLATAEDACDGVLTVSATTVTTPGTCPGNRTVTRTFSAADTDGNRITATQVVTFVDGVAPALVAVPANLTIECGAAEPTGVPTATDVCDPKPSVTVTASAKTGVCAGQTILTRTFTATDACGNTATATQVVTIEDRTKPTLANVPRNVTIDCDTPEPTAMPSASDLCDAAPSVTVVRTEAAASCDGSKTVTRTFTATDACGNSSTASQVVTVVDRNAPVFASVPADVALTCGQALPTDLPVASDGCASAVTITEDQLRTDGTSANDYSITRIFSASDPCGNVAVATQLVTYSDSGLPKWTFVPADLSLACGSAAPSDQATAEDGCDGVLAVATTSVTMVGTCAGKSVITRTFTAQDTDGNRVTATQVVTFEDRTAPVLAGVPTSTTIPCGQPEPSAVPTATDACDAKPSVTVVSTTEAGACAGQSILTRLFTATDACGNTVTASQVITVEDRSKPSLAGVPADVTIDCGVTEPITVPTATDACDPSPKLTVVRTERPGACAGSKEVTRVFTATDACGNSSTASQVITIKDSSKPVLAAVPASVTLQCGQAEPTALPTITDACDASPTVNVSRTEAAGVCAGAKTVTRVFTATDACGNTATASQVITFEDKAKPALAGVPRNVTIDCGAPEPTTLPTATDGCDPAPAITVARTETVGICTGAKTITRVFMATDACGNTATASQIVTVVDKTPPTFADVPADAALSCGAALPTLLPTATDACTGTVTIETEEVRTDGKSANEYTVTRVFTAIDACGNAAVATQLVTYTDSGLPEWTFVPAPATLACGDAVPTALATAEDGCDGVLKATITSATTAGACAGSSSVTRTFTAADSDGNRITATQVITVRDVTAPVLANVPSDVTLSCGAAEPTALPTASDACDPKPLISVVREEVAGACAGQRVVTRTFSATDACGNVSTASQKVTFEDATKPTLTSIPTNVTIECGAVEPTSLPTATDACDPAPKVTVTRSEVTGACGFAKTVVRTFTATDACGNTTTASQVITIEDRTKPTLASVPASTTIQCGVAEPTAMPTATDACDPAPKVTVTRTETAGVCASAKTITRVFKATDACGNTVTASQVITVEDKTKPVLAAVPTNVKLTCGQAMPTALPTVTDACDAGVTVTATSTRADGSSVNNYTVTRLFTATDACGNEATASQVVTYTDGGAPTWTAVPADVTLACGAALPTTLATAQSGCDGALTVTFADVAAAGCGPAARTVTRTFSAADADGKQIVATQVITFEDRIAPTLANVPPAATIECGTAEPTALPTASDACDAKPVVTVATTTKAGACAGESTVTRVFTATDACGNTATASQVVTVQDRTRPTLASVPPAATIECGAAEPTAIPTASDACDAKPVVTVATTTNTGACAGESIVTRVFTATDACGNTATASQVVTVQDRTKPTLANVPAAATIECGAAEPTAIPTASDACDAKPVVSVATTTKAGACAGESIVTRTFTATDACGNTATASQVVTVQDRTKPTLAGVPAAATIECGTAEPTALPTASDACDAKPVVTVATTTKAGACAGESVVTRVFTATDACGNTATASQVVTVLDRTKPTLAGVPAAATIECGAAEPTALPTASDACDAKPVVTVATTTKAGACAGESVVTRVFKATDACGNTATAAQVITIRDKTAPNLAGVPADVTVTCGQTAPTALPTATDICDKAPRVTVSETRTPGASVNDYTVTRTFTATDACGNTATARQLVSYKDGGAPAWVSVPANLELSCPAEAPSVLAKAEDTCDGTLTVTYADTRTAGACAGSYTIKRTFTASDADGNIIVAEQLIAVADKLAPVLSKVPAATTIACGAAMPTALPTATDACSGEATITERSTSVSGRCAGETIVTRVFVATDACGNTATASQLITVQDRTAPSFETIEPLVVLDCGSSMSESAPKATDACGTVVVTFADVAGAKNCASSGDVTRVWTATDACGNTSTVSQVIRTVDRVAPVWTEVPGAITVECGAAVPVVLAKAEDICSGVGTVTYADRRTDGVCGGSYDIVRTFSVSDGCGNPATTSQTISFRDRVAPVISNVPADISLRCEQPLPSNLPVATDACQGAVSIVETRETIAGACASSNVTVRVFTATDACGNKSVARQRVTRSDNTKPVFATTLSDLELSCGQAAPKVDVVATDNCDTKVSVTYSETFDGTASSCAGRGALVRVWTAIDNCGNVATMRQRVITVDRVAPVLGNLPRSVTINCGSPIAGGKPTATDNCDKDVRIYHLDKELPQNCGYTIQRTWYAEDVCGNKTSGVQSILVVDKDKPVFETKVKAEVTIACGDAFPTVTLSARDVCDSDLTYAEETLDLGPGTCPGEKLVMRVFTATDDCGNQAVMTQQVTVVDRSAPVLTAVPASMDVACSAYDYSKSQPTATDACSPTATLGETSKPTQVNRDGKMIDALVRTWTATDACGNSSTATQLLVFSGAAARVTVTTASGPVTKAVCVGDMVTLTAPAGGTDYTWNTGAKGATLKVRAETTREYTVSFGGSCSGQAKAVVMVAPRPSFAVAAVPKLCEGQTLKLSVKTDAAGVTWTGPLGFEAEGKSVEMEDMSNMQSGYYYATAAAGTGCALKDSVLVEVGLGACAEICGNGIDDDSDGLVDCADPDCNCCSLTEAVLTTECRDSGTPKDPSDDVYAVYVDLKGEHLAGKAFRVSGDAKLDAIYPGQRVLLGLYPVAKASVSFDFTSAVDATCALKAQRVTSPGRCTDACDVTLVSTEVGACVDGQFDLRVTVRYTNPSGALLINGKRFALTGSFGEATFTLPRLSCTGELGSKLRLRFEGSEDCGANSKFDAACPDDACLPILVELGARP